MIDTNTIIAYLEQRLDAETLALVEQRMAESASFKKKVTDMQLLLQWTNEIQQQKSIDTAKHWRLLSDKIRWLEMYEKTLRYSRNFAAALFIPLLFALGYTYTQTQNQVPISHLTVSAASGVRTKITLPDSSEVWLNSGTQITYPSVFTGKVRQVSLSGEAYFKVQSDKEHRFEVKLPNGFIASAYGTEFNIKSYQNDDRIEVSLAQGKLTVVGNNKQTDLKPGYMASIDHINGSLTVSEANIYLLTAWKDNKLLFRRENMASIAEKLSRHFNVDIEVQGKRVNNYYYSASFSEESLNEILGLLIKAAPFKVNEYPPVLQPDLTYTKRRIVVSD